MIGKKLRFSVLTRDGYRCRYCGRDATTAVLHLDHIFPRAAGGADTEDNLVTACSDCNLGKSDRLIIGAPDGFFIQSRFSRTRTVVVPAKLAGGYIKPVPCNPPPVGKIKHELWFWEIDSLDEIDDNCQLALIWCETHQRYEWHNVPIDWLFTDCIFTRELKAGWVSDMGGARSLPTVADRARRVLGGVQ